MVQVLKLTIMFSFGLKDNPAYEDPNYKKMWPTATGKLYNLIVTFAEV